MKIISKYYLFARFHFNERPSNAGAEGRRTQRSYTQVSRMKAALFAVPSSDLFGGVCRSAIHLQRQKLPLLKSFANLLDVCEVLQWVII